MKNNFQFQAYLLTLAAVFFSLSLPAQPPFQSSIDEIARAYLHDKNNHALVIGIISNDVQAVRGYGTMSEKDPSPPDGRTIFEVGAVTSVFTTSLMMEASMNGAFELTDRVQNYLPANFMAPTYYPYVCREKEIPDPTGDEPRRTLICEPDMSGGYFCITFCDLASHTTGLPKTSHGLYNWDPFRRELKNIRRNISPQQLYRHFGSTQLDQAPGIVFDYSTEGIAILGNLLADISGKNYESLLIEKILDPVGMEDTRLKLSSDQNRRLAPGHNRRGRRTQHLFLDGMAPAGGLHATANDLLKFLSANLQTEDGYFAEVFEQVQQPRIETVYSLQRRETMAGYGWLTTRLSEESNLPIHWINGGTEGFRSFIGLNHDRQIAVVILSNSANPVDDIGFKVLEQLVKESLQSGG